MLRKDDPEFKKVVDEAMTEIYKSGEINTIYDKWFQKPDSAEGHQPATADDRRVQESVRESDRLRRSERPTK